MGDGRPVTPVQAPSRPAQAQGSPDPAGVRHDQPTASIILVNYNGRGYLAPCLRSLLRAAHPGQEIILVDNASTDGSVRYVEQHFPQVWVVRNEANLGFGRGNNRGAQQATGPVLVFLNPDTTVEPGWLEALLAALEADPKAGLATAKILLLDDPARINTCGNDMHLTGLTLCRGMGAERGAFDERAEVGAVSGAAFAIRRDLFDALGGFDEAFFLYVEDSDLSLRARLAGARCLYVPDAVVYHDYALRFGPGKTFYQERNRHLMLLKALRWRTLLVLAPALALGELVTWGFVLLRKREQVGEKLRAYAWIARHWGQVMAARRRTQALRRVRDWDLLAQSTHRLDYGQVGDGRAARLAQAVFDPLFAVWRRVALALVRW
jgi:GT2 family glycosyltransferase